jgi:hypothetical protein
MMRVIEAEGSGSSFWAAANGNTLRASNMTIEQRINTHLLPMLSSGKRASKTFLWTVAKRDGDELVP